MMVREPIVFVALLLAACGDDSAGTGGGEAASTGATTVATTGASQAATTSSTAGGGEAQGGGGGSSTGGGGSGQGGAGGEGGAAPPREDFGSGSRLRARYLDGGQGARVFSSFVDTALEDVLCSPGLASDGSSRCIPGRNAAPVRFTDAACTVPVLLREVGCPPPLAMFKTPLQDPGECVASSDRGSFEAPRWEVHHVGDPVLPIETYSWNGVTCNPLGPVSSRFFTVYASAGVVPPEEMASFEEEIEVRDGGLASTTLRSEDGAYVLDAFRNAETGEICTHGGDTCFPPHVAADGEGTLHLDAACLDAALVAQSTFSCAETPPPTIALVSTPDGPTPHALGAAVDPDDLYRMAFGDCDLVSPSTADGLRVFEVGAPLDVPFPTFGLVEIGEGRLRVSANQSPGGALLSRARSFTDVEIGEGCQMARDSSGVLRCIARVRSSHNGQTFTDPACTIPYFDEASGDEFFSEISGGCHSELQLPDSVRAVVPFDGPVFGALAGECNPAGTRVGVTLGAELGVEVFAEIAEVVE